MLVGDSPLIMRNTRMAGNTTWTVSATSEDVGAGGSLLELDGPGTITDTAITDNTSTAIGVDGDIAVNSGLALHNFNNNPRVVTVQDSIISNNTGEATSTTGSATVLGGGVFNNSLLTMRNVAVIGNVGRVHGPSGVAQGGGIWNGVLLSGPPVELTLQNTRITRNVLTGGAGSSLAGGGLYTTSPVTLTHTRIALNRPDQCVGCSLPPAAKASAITPMSRSKLGSHRAGH